MRHSGHRRCRDSEPEHPDQQANDLRLAGRDVAVQHERRPRQPEGHEEQGIEPERRDVQIEDENVGQSGDTGHRHQVEEELGPTRVPLDPALCRFAGDDRFSHRLPSSVLILTCRLARRSAGADLKLGHQGESVGVEPVFDDLVARDPEDVSAGDGDDGADGCAGSGEAAAVVSCGNPADDDVVAVDEGATSMEKTRSDERDLVCPTKSFIPETPFAALPSPPSNIAACTRLFSEMIVAATS